MAPVASRQPLQSETRVRLTWPSDTHKNLSVLHPVHLIETLTLSLGHASHQPFDGIDAEDLMVLAIVKH
ncbi:hypothetical protein Syun_011957 [Stephania yunnanensis]|uniref:Uncharacterized protein n=1 Tax=Stephania yunnanensis TaxID=152371 RepID=A0AAP0JYL4_9MAGN